MDRENRIQEYLREPEMDRDVAEAIVAQEDVEAHLARLGALIHYEEVADAPTGAKTLREIADVLGDLVAAIEVRLSPS